MALRERKIKLSDLTVAIYLDSTEAIKSYLEAAPEALGFVSRPALTRELAAGLLEVVPIAGLALPRQFEAVWVQGQQLPRHPNGGRTAHPTQPGRPVFCAGIGPR
jgi:DNA-binding transcriptional LysR family regulator